MTIRKATIHDIPLIRKMADVAFRETYRDILSAEQMEYMMVWMYSEESLMRQMTLEGHQFFVAEMDGSSVGYASVSQDEADVFHLQKLYVMPEHQGQGVGKRLLEEVVRYLKQLHPAPLRLELNVNRRNRAVGFYRRMGLIILRQGDFPIGNGYYMNDYIMGKAFFCRETDETRTE